MNLFFRPAVLAALVIAAGCAAADPGSLAAAAPVPVAPKEKTVLFNGKDLAGWVVVAPEDRMAQATTVWSVSGGVIQCKGAPFCALRTETPYAHYRLHLEWRWTARPTNSGVMLHMNDETRVWPTSFEAQLAHQNAGDLWRIGQVSCNDAAGKPFIGIRLPKRNPSNEKPPGEWNSYDIDCSDAAIRLSINGLVQNEVTNVLPSAGFIGFQSEGSPIEFRNIYLEPGAAPAPAESKALDFTLENYDGKTVSLHDLAGKIVVLEWMNYDCPISMRHYQRGTFNKLAEKYKDKGVVWLAVNSTNFATAEKDKAHAEKFGVPYPILSDPRGTVGHLFNAKSTPDIRILKDGKVVYSGAIDDDPGGIQESPTNYVDQALAELLAGKPVSLPETKSYGCSVKYAE